MLCLSARIRWPVVVAAVASSAFSRTSLAETRPVSVATQVKNHLALGGRAARVSRWDEALAEYKAAQALSPSAAALAGMAESYDALRQDVAAYDAFRELLDGYGDQLSPGARSNAEARIVALGQVTGVVVINVNVAGAAVSIDGVPAGLSPVAPFIRVPSGVHRVRAVKPGFDDAEAAPTVGGGQSARLDLVMNETLRAAPVASPSTRQVTTLTIATADRQGQLSIDGKPVGQGSFEGQLPLGPHHVHIQRDGYASLDKDVVLHAGESYAETFSLSPILAGGAAGGVGGVERGHRPFEGLVGGVMFAGAFQVNSLNGDFSQPCSFAATGNTTGCSAGSPAGGALMGYVGYTANPLGVDVLFGGQLDTATVSLTVKPGTGQPVTESFTTPRLGGFIAPRARISAQTKTLRFTFAAGLGLAVREVSLSAGGVSALTGNDPKGTYVAPAITVEGSAHIRATDGVAIGFGLMYWAEGAGSGVQLANGTLLKAPAYVLSAAQTFIMPYIGVELGP